MKGREGGGHLQPIRNTGISAVLIPSTYRVLYQVLLKSSVNESENTSITSLRFTRESFPFGVSPPPSRAGECN